MNAGNIIQGPIHNEIIDLLDREYESWDPRTDAVFINKGLFEEYRSERNLDPEETPITIGYRGKQLSLFPSDDVERRDIGCKSWPIRSFP